MAATNTEDGTSICEEQLRTHIETYFHQGYENRVILDFLRYRHSVVLSLATLKRRLQDYGLRRRALRAPGFHDIDEVHLRRATRRDVWT